MGGPVIFRRPGRRRDNSALIAITRQVIFGHRVRRVDHLLLGTQVRIPPTRDLMGYTRHTFRQLILLINRRLTTSRLITWRLWHLRHVFVNHVGQLLNHDDQRFRLLVVMTIRHVRAMDVIHGRTRRPSYLKFHGVLYQRRIQRRVGNLFRLLRLLNLKLTVSYVTFC